MNFKKYTPFIIPTISLLLVLFLAFRWYNLRTQRDADLRLDEVKIDNLPAEEAAIVVGSPEASTINLEPKDEELVSGQIRYHLANDRVLFNVVAELPYDDSVAYQVWLSPKDKETFSRGFVLSYGKGGYTGSASVSQDQLPLELIITKEIDATDDLEGEELLRGVIENTDALQSEE